MDEKKKYRVLKPVAIDGIVQPGSIVELTEEQAANIGIGEYLEPYIEGQEPTPPAEPAGETGSEEAIPDQTSPSDEGGESGGESQPPAE